MFTLKMLWEDFKQKMRCYVFDIHRYRVARGATVKICVDCGHVDKRLW